MSSLALYRKYRSSDFSQVVGQEHVTSTLVAAIGSGRLSHAYLFTGPRGTGKTSVARLLARALNCTGQSKPCNKCANCLAAINSSLDLIEIDAASNRSIDAIRDLREKVNLAPTQGKYKIYIIDEVHMLTSEAFNALLKTLEEPPSHVVFIMATTEAHKLPETIVSRTQRFNFKPISEADIVKQLTVMSKAEGIDIDKEALEIIATAARGGFRDAISMLDQLASSGGGKINAGIVRQLLGYSDTEELVSLSHKILAGDTRGALEISLRLEAGGAQPGQVAAQLADLWRSVLLAGSGAVHSTDPAVAKLAVASSALRTAEIVDTVLEVVRSQWPQLALEVAIVKLSSAQPDLAVTRAGISGTAKPSMVPGPAQPAQSAESKPAASSAKNLSETTAEVKPAGPIQESAAARSLNPALWPKVLLILKAENNSLAALVQMYPVDFGEGEVTIKPRFNFHRDLFIKNANRTAIEAAASKVYGVAVKVQSTTDESGVKAKRPHPDPASELVSSALEILGGEIVE